MPGSHTAPKFPATDRAAALLSHTELASYVDRIANGMPKAALQRRVLRAAALRLRAQDDLDELAADGAEARDRATDDGLPEY